MKRKTNAALVLTLILIISVFSGCSRNETAESPQPEPAQTSANSGSELIAVVNEDVGVEYSGNNQNYSEAFIKNLDPDTFEVVSDVTAERGLEDGTYAGVLVFPANLSAGVLNINYKSPQAIKIEYEISDELDKAAYDATYDRLLSVYHTFNNKLAYAYIDNLMDEIELGQYNVDEIFNNDESNLAAARKLAEGNYNNNYEEPEMPQQDLQFQKENTDSYQKKGGAYAENVGKLYKEAYSAAYKKARKDSITDSDLQAVYDSRDSMKSMLGEIAAFNDENTDSLKACSDYIDAADDYQTKVAEYESAVASYMTATENYITALNEYWEAMNECKGSSDLPDEQKEKINRAEKNCNSAKTALTEAKTNIETTHAAMNDESIKNAIESKPSCPDGSTLPTKEDAENSAKSVETAVVSCQKKINSQAEQLKPKNMIKTAMADGKQKQTYADKISEEKASFLKDTKTVTDTFGQIQEDNLSKLNKAYTANSKYMQDKVKVMNEAGQKNQKSLDRSIKVFKKTAEQNSLDTKKRLVRFRGMLSSAKVDGRVSSDVMKFMIQPIELVEK